LLTLCPPVGEDGGRISSSEIRNLLREGDTLRAASYLTKPYSIGGTVSHGENRGKSLGFPTANLVSTPDKLLPKSGVYVTRAVLGARSFLSVTNVGVRPTFQSPHSSPQSISLEVHIMDFAESLYGEKLQIDFFERLRDEKRFSSVDELRTQISYDIQQARNFESLRVKA